MGTVIRVFLALLFTTSAFAQYEGSITVQRMLLEVRVTKHGGEPVADLTPADFTVTVGGQPVQVASAIWNDEWKTGNPACPDRRDRLSSTYSL
jgi:antitoxin (DNA-binding transcriptional repressor) of toxin-antitoxin stability system